MQLLGGDFGGVGGAGFGWKERFDGPAWFGKEFFEVFGVYTWANGCAFRLGGVCASGIE